MNKVEYMWGTCDGKGIIFTRVHDTEWICDVPPDLVDGRYIVEIYAELTSGGVIYTTAILYMFDGRCVSLEFVNDGIYVIIKLTDYVARLKQDDYVVSVSDYTVRLIEDGLKVVISWNYTEKLKNLTFTRVKKDL